MESRSHTPSDDANGLVFDEWSSASSFDLLSNEHTTSVWRPAHLLGLARAARTTRVVTPAIEMQMTWDDDESTTRMWSHEHFGGPGFGAPNPNMDSTPRYPERVPTARMERAMQAQMIAATRTAPPPPPPPVTRRTGQLRVARQAPPPPPPPTRRAAPLPAARQTGPYPVAAQTSARTTGARPAVRSTQPNRPLALVPDIATVTHTHVTDELGVETDSQPLHWLWTLASGAGLFVAVLAGVVLLPIGRPSVPVMTASASPVGVEAANVADDTASTEQTQVTQDQHAAVPMPAVNPQRPSRRWTAREPSNTATPRSLPSPNAPVDAAPLPEPGLSDAQEAAPGSAAARHEEATLRTAARNQEPGLVRINSRPWAQVFVDGKPRGTTPQMGLAVNPGHHTVQLVNTQMGMSKTFPLDIQSGEIVTKVVNLIE